MSSTLQLRPKKLLRLTLLFTVICVFWAAGVLQSLRANAPPPPPEPAAPFAVSAPENSLGIQERRNSVTLPSGGEIHYHEGIVRYKAIGISLPGPGRGFAHIPTYCNRHENGSNIGSNDGNFESPQGVNWHTGLLRLLEMDNNVIYVVGEGTASSKYEKTSTYWQGTQGIDAEIHSKSDELVLRSTEGSVVYFYDFDQGELSGKPKRLVDPIGNDILTMSYYATGPVNELKTVTHSTGRTWNYTYINNAGKQRISTIEIKNNFDIIVAEIEYLYFDSQYEGNSQSDMFHTGSGTDGDLMRIIVKEKDSNENIGDRIRTIAFRYYTGSKAHKLKYVVGPQSYKDLESTYGDPLKSTDVQIDEYDTHYYQYDSIGRVTGSFVQTTECNCSSGETLYAYEERTLKPTDFNSWATRVTQTNPDGTAKIVDVNIAGSIITEIIQSDDAWIPGEQRWITHYDFDSEGRVVGIAYPSAVSSYEESTHTATVLSSSGLIHGITYDSSGNLVEQRVKEGSARVGYLVRKVAYGSKSLGSNTIYFPTSEKTYTIETTADNSGAETTFTYEWYPDVNDVDEDSDVLEDSLQVEEIETTLVSVPTIENGEGVPHSRSVYFDTKGQMVWGKDESGSITYREYDPHMGVVVTLINDANTAGLGPPGGYTSSSGLHLEFSYSLDDYGRVISMTDPEGRVEKYFYTHLLNGNAVTLTYPHVDDSGNTAETPVAIVVYDHNGDRVTEAMGVPGGVDEPDSNLFDDFTTNELLIEDAFLGSLYGRVDFEYSGGKKIKRIEWSEGSDGSQEKWETVFAYDTMGRIERERDDGGTIKKHTYTVAGKIKTLSIGTSDGPSGNMTTVRRWYYDNEELSGGTTGNGNLTREEHFIDSSSSHIVNYLYDWRDRRTSASHEEDVVEVWTYDNNNRPTEYYLYQGDPTPANLREKRERNYDVRGNVYKIVTYEVEKNGPVPPLGTIGSSTSTNIWRDPRGAFIKIASPKGLFRKYEYDGAQRLIKSYTSYDTDETAYADATGVSDDIVIEQVEFDHDKTGKILLKTEFSRREEHLLPGALDGSSGIRHYECLWYDAMHRPTHVADYGTNGGSDLIRPLVPPIASDSVLLTVANYDEVGRIQDEIDVDGDVKRYGYDNFGRLTSIVDNFVDGIPGDSDDDRKQVISYNSVHQVTHRKIWMSSSETQETEWVYGVAIGTGEGQSRIASNRLVKIIRHPDPSTGQPADPPGNQEIFAYNIQEDVIHHEGRNGIKHVFEYDGLGRLVVDKVSNTEPWPDDVDSSIKRIQWSYDVSGRPVSVVSFTDVSGAAGSVDNEVRIVYNGFGQIRQSFQEHSGVVDSGTLSVSYSWSQASSGDPISRLIHLQYPGSGRRIYFQYDNSTGSTDHEKMDWVLNRISGISNVPSSLEDRIVDYSYEGFGRIVSKKYEVLGSGEVVFTYGYDSLGRRSSVNVQGLGNINDFAYGFNRSSAPIWREETYFGGKDERYTYDELGRVDGFERGDLDVAKTSIESVVRSQGWTLDLLGNWEEVSTGGDATERSHNRANQIDEVDVGSGSGDPVYDENGNTEFIEKPAPSSRTFIYDGWNRVVGIKFGAQLVADYSYDGMNRRIRDGSADRDYYYTAQWQVLSERDGDSATDDSKMEYVWGYGYIDEIISRSEDGNNDGDTQDAADESVYYVQDDNWNVTTLIDEAGSVVERYLYDPYGLATIFSGMWGGQGSAVYRNRVLFGGRLWNASGLVYDYRRREYSPYIGRFLQTDPIGIWGDPGSSGNGYLFVGGSPLANVDPIGEKGGRRGGGIRELRPYKHDWHVYRRNLRRERERREEAQRRRRNEEEVDQLEIVVEVPIRPQVYLMRPNGPPIPPPDPFATRKPVYECTFEVTERQGGGAADEGFAIYENEECPPAESNCRVCWVDRRSELRVCSSFDGWAQPHDGDCAGKRYYSECKYTNRMKDWLLEIAVTKPGGWNAEFRGQYGIAGLCGLGYAIRPSQPDRLKPLVDPLMHPHFPDGPSAGSVPSGRR